MEQQLNDLAGPINFLIFTGEIVNVTWEERMDALPATLSDMQGSDLLVQMGTMDLQGNAPPIGANGIVSAPYKSKRLSFEVTLREVDSDRGILRCDYSKAGKLVNHRAHSRSRFAEEDSAITVVFTAETLSGPITFHSKRLCDFSVESLSLVVERTQGLVLPSDDISALKILKDGTTIFEAAGEVQRIAPSKDDSDTIFAVIAFRDPEARPKYDIEPNKRRSERVTMTDRNDAFVEFVHPLNGSKISAYVLDLSIAGMSIVVSSEKYTLPPGLLISEASLQLPLRARRNVPLRVKAVTEIAEEGPSMARISLEFAVISPELTQEVVEFVYQCFSENLSDTNIDDHHELWQFYFDTRFIYDSKRRQLQNYSQAVINTQKRLFEANTPLLKKMIYKEHGQILGHGLAIKVYDNTLMLQHLNAKKTNSGSVAKDIIRGMATLFLDQHVNAENDNRYVCTYFRPNNLFPSLVFGESAALIDNPDICWTMDFQFCLRTNQPMLQGTDEGIESREATELDGANLEKLLIDNGDLQLLRLERLARDTLTELGTFDEYSRLGLYRYRRVFVAERARTQSLCYAVCTYSSPGLNLSELTNSVKFFFNTEDVEERRKLINGISPMVMDSYNETQMRDPVFMLREGQPIPNGFAAEKVYTLWSMDMLYPRIFKQHIDLIFSDLRQFIKKKKAS